MSAFCEPVTSTSMPSVDRIGAAPTAVIPSTTSSASRSRVSSAIAPAMSSDDAGRRLATACRRRARGLRVLAAPAPPAGRAARPTAYLHRSHHHAVGARHLRPALAELAPVTTITSSPVTQVGDRRLHRAGAGRRAQHDVLPGSEDTLAQSVRSSRANRPELGRPVVDHRPAWPRAPRAAPASARERADRSSRARRQCNHAPGGRWWVASLRRPAGLRRRARGRPPRAPRPALPGCNDPGAHGLHDPPRDQARTRLFHRRCRIT